MAILYPAFKAGGWGYKFLKALYTGARGGVTGGTRKTTEWTTKAGKKMASKIVPGKATKVRGLRQFLNVTKRGEALQESALGKTVTFKGKYGVDSVFKYRKVKGGFVPRSKWYLGEGMRGAAKHGKTVGRHVRKHQKLYTSGVAGAAIWDFLPGKDNE